MNNVTIIAVHSLHEKSATMRLLILSAALLLGTTVAATAGQSYSHAPYERVKIGPNEYITTGAPNCDEPIVSGGPRYCPSGQWPEDYEDLNPVDSPVWTRGDSGNGE
jgi:hypothetical protein